MGLASPWIQLLSIIWTLSWFINFCILILIWKISCLLNSFFNLKNDVTILSIQKFDGHKE